MRQSRGRLAATITAILAASAIAAGCGDDDEGGDEPVATGTTSTATTAPPSSNASAEDEREIAAVIRRSLIQDDPAEECRTLTRRLIGVIYDSPSRCRRLAADDDDDEEDPDEVDVSSVNVTGEQATAQIEASGGGFDDVTGGIDLAQEDGEWKIDDLQPDLLRTLLTAGFEEAAEEDEEELLSSRDVRTCTNDSLGDLPDRELKDLAYDAIGERSGAEERVGRLLLECLGRSDEGRAALRRQFEQGLRQDDDIPRSLRDCLIRRLRQTVPDEQIADLVAARSEGRQPSPQLQQLIQQAALRCRQQPS